MTDPIADMLTRIRNAKHGVPRRRADAVVEAEGSGRGDLEREGYISGYEVDDQPGVPAGA
jgi:ribosomal protein S8